MLLIQIGIVNCATQATIMSENYQVSIKRAQTIFYCSRIFLLFLRAEVQSSVKVLRGGSIVIAMLTSLVNLTYCSHQYTVITNKSENRTWGLVNHLILARCTLLENTFHIIQRQKLGGIISKWQSHKQTHTTRGPKFTNSCYQNLPFRSLTPHVVRGNRYSNTKVDGSIKDRLGLYIKMKNVLILWPRIPTYRN